MQFKFELTRNNLENTSNKFATESIGQGPTLIEFDEPLLLLFSRNNRTVTDRFVNLTC